MHAGNPTTVPAPPHVCAKRVPPFVRAGIHEKMTFARKTLASGLGAQWHSLEFTLNLCVRPQMHTYTHT